MVSERDIIYFALSNLIKDCLESLESIKELPPEECPEEEKEMLYFILNAAMPLEEKYAQEIGSEELTIKRPNWADLDGSQ